LVVVLEGHRHEFSVALSSASIWVLLLAAVLQIVALLARTEAWHGCINAAGGTVDGGSCSGRRASATSAAC
jgi:hypothetical protein